MFRNLCGFQPVLVKILGDRFPAFLDNALAGNPLKGEYLLPTVVGELLQEDRVTVRVLASADKWYGVTYKEDKQTVVEAMAEKAAEGLYPTPLWS